MDRHVHRSRGASLTEITVVIAVLGVSSVIGIGGFGMLGERSALRSTVHATATTIQQARMLSVYRGVNHFVVIDPDENSLGIFEDASAPFGSFDAGDLLISRESWPSAVELALPGGSLVDPLLGNSLSSAWSLPLPDASAAWGSSLRGVMVTPAGTIMSAESTPQVLGVGTVVFEQAESGAGAVSMDGRAGAVHGFRLLDGTWEKI